MSDNLTAFLDLLVDNDFVIAAYLIKFEEGIVAYWPKEHMDSEAAEVGDALSLPMKPGLYLIMGGDRLLYRYVGLVIGKGLLLFRVSDKVPLQKFAEKLSKTYFIFIEKSLNRRKERQGPRTARDARRSLRSQ